MRDLKVTLVQTELIWEDVESNLSILTRKIDSIQEDTQLIILPEMFSTAFSTNVEKLAEDMNGPAVRWLLDMSRRTGADIAGSVMLKENGSYLNRLIWARPDGTFLTYDKRHLFRMGREHDYYSAGSRHLTVDLSGWKIRPFICYDLRFPCWIRNIENAYDIAVFVANWPGKRSFHWNTLLTARAIENQCYVIGVNRVGVDGKGLAHSGDSCIMDYFGETVFQHSYSECIHTAALSYEKLRDYRNKFPAWMDSDPVMIKTGSGIEG
ncbi:MAG: amidohydrolase [Desulfobacterales bacterium]|nr:amidohydrolase [Desulfobacterales bacterium]MDD4073332.1 amidohydrolase [Desulfobacterales bacterium]MDD4391786.1 amidohydrolase [Desulfobacterales bacterium]